MRNLNNKKVNTEHTLVIQHFLRITDNKENTFARAYPAIMSLNCDSTLKLLAILLVDDARLNKGWVKWAHQTYADKLGKSRNSIHIWFKKLESLNILLPSKENKPGGRLNKHAFDLTRFIKHYN